MFDGHFTCLASLDIQEAMASLSNIAQLLSQIYTSRYSLMLSYLIPTMG